MKRIAFSIALAVAALNIQAQDNSNFSKLFNHFDLGVTLGTTGIGLDVAMPVGNYVKLRTGFEVMPRFNYNMNFGVESFDGTATTIDQSTFDHMADLLYGLTGFKVDQNVTMKGKPTMWNFKFLVDIYPFKNNKHWHLTAGFHWGPSKIAEAVNAPEDSPSLFAVGMYNHIYDVAYNDMYVEPTPLVVTETAGAIYLDPIIEETILSMGRMGIPIGKYSHDMTDAQGNVHKQGESYYMLPNEHSMVSAEARTNSFKPYLGVGYEGRLIKGNDNYKIGFDAGVMFWGGTPKIITHDGTDLANDIEDISGKVGTYVDLIKGVKAFPVLNLRITRTIF